MHCRAGATASVERHELAAMSRTRLIVMSTVAAMLIGLMAWQYQRLSRVEACLAEGKIWNGPASRCDTPKPVILERDLKRT